MNSSVPALYLFFAAILAGFALIKVSAVSILASMADVIEIAGGLVIAVFSIAIIYQALRTLFGR